jgi:PAS domain S-box-containing protein
MLNTFKTILDATPDPLVIVNVSGNILFANKQAEKLFEYSQSEFQEMFLEQLMPERYREIHKKHTAEYFKRPRFRPMGGELELYGLTKGGREFPVEISLSPLDSEVGLLAMASIRDVTKKKNLVTLWKIERDYNRDQFDFLALLEATPDALIIVDRMGHILYANGQSRKLFGYEQSEFLDMILEQLIPERYRRAHTRYREHYFSKPRFRPMGKDLELYCLKKDGTEIEVEISLSPLEAEEGLLAMATIRGVSERKGRVLSKVEREYNQRQNNFIAYLCHELRNPIGGIRGSVDCMKEGSKDILVNSQKNKLGVPEMQRISEAGKLIADGLNDIDDCLDHIRTILDNSMILLDIERNDLKIDLKSFDFSKEMWEVCRILQSKAERKGLYLTVSLIEENLWIVADPLRLKQIVINLGSDIISKTNEGSVKITFIGSKSEKGDRISLEIRVGGPKYLESYELERLLEDVSVISMGNKYGKNGGIGFIIARILANRMGGKVAVETGKDFGMAYVFSMHCDCIIKKSEILPGPSKELCILVVEDNEINRKTLEFSLKKAGFRCILAENGLEAISQYVQHSNSIDLILMDVMMPVLDGLGATREIRRLESEGNLARVPIIGLSGNALQVNEQDAFDAGMDAYLTKPYKKEEVFQRMAVLLFQENKMTTSKSNVQESQKSESKEET